MGQSLKLLVAHSGSTDSSFRAVAKGETFQKSCLPSRNQVMDLSGSNHSLRRRRRRQRPRPRPPPPASTRCLVSVDQRARTRERADPNVHCPWPSRRRTVVRPTNDQQALSALSVRPRKGQGVGRCLWPRARPGNQAEASNPFNL